MAYIGGDQALLFGGSDGSFNGETWIYDLSADTWTQQIPSASPSARSYHAMAYIGDDQVMLFGGFDDSGLDDETWIYDLSDASWTQRSPASSPSARDSHEMAYIGGDQVILFGGSTSSGFDDATWIYDLGDTTWTQQSPSSSPSGQTAHSMAYIGGDEIILFGYDGSNIGETWIYDLSNDTWTQKSPASSPSSRVDHAMAYIGGDQVMLFGGYDDSYDDETWIYDLSDDNWIQDLNTMQPSPRYGHDLAETSMDSPSYPVLFGGSDSGGNNDETWTFGEGDYLVLNPPSIDSVTDVPFDQGRQVVILWQRSFLDDPAYNLIINYSIWRLYPYGDETAGFCTEWDGTSLFDPEKPVYRVLPDERGRDRQDYWQLVGSVPAHFLDEYAFIAPTLEDSSSSGIPYFTFFVSAHTTDPFVFYDSDPDSGYSVDNINPMPTLLRIQLAGGPFTVTLQWNQVTHGVDGSSELGSISYRIHSDTYPYFMPGPGNLLTTTSSLSYDHADPGIGDPSTNLYYVVIATDGSDNESGPSNRTGETDFQLP
jgi:N-acetylneuraminic acid mutarotase